ncbi:IS3 family transposase [Pseudomonas putida]|uniref:IS3 family transposase n=2 Tax=Pseudomonadaceae TaxID=135621 RepID=UPI002DBF012F|nr:IS3 family transposase [Pseudomonas putida]WRW03134.1 IS3 family transposase [Pseudomonas putida]WRW05880.1 IS3 family transposase [Pseudomonas putida]
MAEVSKRRVHSAEFKAKVGMEAARGVKTLNEIGQQYGVHPVVVGQWRKEIVQRAATLFEGKRGPKPAPHADEERLYGEIGRLKMELDWLKKKSGPMSAPTRMGWIEPSSELAITQQCELAQVARASFYGRHTPCEPPEEDLLLMRLIDEQYTRRPFYGSRRMVVFLGRQGHLVNRKRVQRLMRVMALAGMAPGPATSKPHPEHRVYPYLLRGAEVTRPDQVWSTDITYIRLAHGFVYLVAIIDWYSRRVLGWRISNSLDTAFCVDCLEEALDQCGQPEIFNTDQGSQFTSEAFTGVLKRAGIAISMDGRGRALDNIFVERLWRSVKYEDVYLKGYGTVAELTLGLTEYFAFYNGERPHQALDYRVPDEVYAAGVGGGASIPDHFNERGQPTLATTGQRHSAAIEEVDAA